MSTKYKLWRYVASATLHTELVLQQAFELPTGAARSRMTRHSGRAIFCLTTFQQEVMTTADVQSPVSYLDRSAS